MWLQDTRYARWAVSILSIWLKAGYYYIIFDAGLKNIPTELYEETTSTETAAGNLRAIGQLVLDSGVLEKRKGLQLQQRDDIVTIHSSRGRMYVRFSISECR